MRLVSKCKLFFESLNFQLMLFMLNFELFDEFFLGFAILFSILVNSVQILHLQFYMFNLLDKLLLNSFNSPRDDLLAVCDNDTVA